MKRASYREACSWIALNDDAGSSGALDMVEVGEMVSTCLVADLFEVDLERVALDIVRIRRRVAESEKRLGTNLTS